MALGTLGSTLNDELNRLANGGTYRTMGNMVDEALAAKQWANRENINPYSTDTVGILNEIAGLGTNRQNWLDFNGVCNYIAGTTGLPAAAALRQVYPTTDLLTGVASYYVDATDASASGQTVTNLGTAGSLLPTTLGSSTAADSNDPKFLDHTGTNYVYLPGVSGNRLSIPDAANLDTTDLDFRMRISLDSPTTTSNYASRLVGDPNRAWLFGYVGGATAARMSLAWYPTGSAASAISVGGTVGYENGYTANVSHWVRVTLDVDNGAGGYEVKFFTAPDSTTVPTSWTQVGTTITGGTTTSLPNITSGIDISQSTAYLGKVFRAQLMDSINGTAIVDIDTSVITAGSATSFTALTGQTVTINRSSSGRKTVAVTQPTWLFGTDDYMEVNNRYMSSGTYLYLPGVASNNCTTPDAAALDITGDLDIRVKVALDDWTPSANQYLVAKLQTQRSYGLQLNTDGRLVFVRSTDGSATTSIFSGVVAVPFTDGATGWVRVTFDVDNGAGGNDTIFYTSTDGTTWTQLGATQTNAGTTATFNSNASLEIGSGFAGVSGPARGKFFRAQVLNGINGTVAFDANFETSITSLNQASFTESSANAATVTINRSGSAYRSAGITAAGYLYPGATNTFAASATDFLNFGASDSFTLITAMRSFATTGSGTVLAKRISAATADAGYYLYRYQNVEYGGEISDGTIERVPTKSGTFTGTIDTFAIVRNVSLDNFLAYVNASPGTSVSDTTTGSLSYFEPMRIGRLSGSGTAYLDAEIYATVIFRQALTAAQIRQINNYFANREVYL